MNRTLNKSFAVAKEVVIYAGAIAALTCVMGLRNASAQDQFKVATGSQTLDEKTKKPNSTYTWMFRDLNARCQAALPMTEVGSNGSIDNLELLANKEVHAAIVQGDLLEWLRQNDPAKVESLKTVFTLAPEELHFIAYAGVKTEGGISLGKFNIGGEKVQFRDLSDLKGRTIGAFGGSVRSGRVVSKEADLGFRVEDAGNDVNLLKGLKDGKYDVILVVAGSPSSLVAGLDQNYRLLPVTAETAAKLKSYRKATLTYSKMNQTGVPTIATQAQFVTRQFRDPAMLDKLAALRGCVAKNVYPLQDANGTHPKWSAVKPDDKGTWDYYDLPAAK